VIAEDLRRAWKVIVPRATVVQTPPEETPPPPPRLRVRMNPRMNLNKSRMSREENENPQEPGSHRPIFQKNLSLMLRA